MCKPPTRLGAPWPTVSSLIEASRARARNTCSPLSGRPCEFRDINYNKRLFVPVNAAPVEPTSSRPEKISSNVAKAPAAWARARNITTIARVSPSPLQHEEHAGQQQQQQPSPAPYRQSSQEPSVQAPKDPDSTVLVRRKSFPKSNRVALQRHAHLNRFAAARVAQIDAAVRHYFGVDPEQIQGGLVHRKVAFYSDWWRAAFETSGEDVYEDLLWDMRRASARNTEILAAKTRPLSSSSTAAVVWSRDGDMWGESLDDDEFDLGPILDSDMMLVVTAA